MQYGTFNDHQIKEIYEMTDFMEIVKGDGNVG